MVDIIQKCPIMYGRGEILNIASVSEIEHVCA